MRQDSRREIDAFAYGAYGFPVDAGFSSNRSLLMKRDLDLDGAAPLLLYVGEAENTIVISEDRWIAGDIKTLKD